MGRALLTAIIALILFAFSPTNDLLNLLFCLIAIFYFRKPARRGAGKAVIVGVAFLTIFLAPLVFRSATCGSRRNGSPSRTSPSLRPRAPD